MFSSCHINEAEKIILHMQTEIKLLAIDRNGIVRAVILKFLYRINFLIILFYEIKIKLFKTVPSFRFFFDIGMIRLFFFEKYKK